jgi:hypothetical protein
MVWALERSLFGSGKESACATAPFTPPTLPHGEAHYIDTPALRVALCPAIDARTELVLKVVVASRGGARLGAVLERPFCIPKFSAYQLLPRDAASGLFPTGGAVAPPPLPSGMVLFHLPHHRASRLALWLATVFPIPEGAVTAAYSSAPPPPIATLSDAAGVFGVGSSSSAAGQQQQEAPPPPSAASLSLDARFACARTLGSTMLRIACAHESGGACVIQCEDMALAGEVLQDLAGFLGVGALESQCCFPGAQAALGVALGRLGELTALRGRLAGEAGEGAGLLKGSVMRGEEARVRGDMGGVRRHYRELRGVVGDLAREHAVRAGVHSALMEVLKEVNVNIQRGAGLRGAWKVWAGPTRARARAHTHLPLTLARYTPHAHTHAHTQWGSRAQR